MYARSRETSQLEATVDNVRADNTERNDPQNWMENLHQVRMV